MTVLMLTTSMHRGGAETHILTLAKALTARGHTVVVASAGGSLTDALREAGIPHETLPLDKPLRLQRARVLLRRLLQKHAPDLIHAHARLPALTARSLAKRRGIPLVVTAHARFRVNPLLRRLSVWGTRSIAVSEDLHQYLREEYQIPAHRVTVIPNGVEAPARRAIFSRGDQLRLAFCSRLDDDCSEGAFLLCRVALRLREQFSHLTILLIGGGNRLPSLRQAAEAVNRQAGAPFVVCTGHADKPMEAFLSVDAVVGVSRVALEAMAVGVPVILGGNEGFLGVLTPERLVLAEQSNFCGRGASVMTEDGLLCACRDLLSRSESERRALGQALSDYARRRHSISAVAEKTERVYADALRATRLARRGALVLCGYYGYGNMGDDTLLFAARQHASEVYPSLSVSALTNGGKRDQEDFGIRCVRRSSVLAVTREIRKARVLVFGGGTLLQDKTSLRSLLYYCSLLLYAAHCKVRTELWANGLEAPHSRVARLLLQKSLARCHRVGLRDELSVRLARRLLGERAPLVRERDLASHTPPAPPARVFFLLRHYALERTPFAIILPKGPPCPATLALLLPWLAELLSSRILPLFVPLYPKEDSRLCQALAQRLGGRVATNLSPHELVGLMRHARTVGSMRLHGLVFARCADAPRIGFGDDAKLEQFCREQGDEFRSLQQKSKNFLYKKSKM